MSSNEARTFASTTSQSVGLLLYAVTLCLGAALLFAIELMFAKVALPLLGGSPEVWNTAMVFFQAMLLLGYTYAHLIATRLRFALQVPLHLAVVALAFIMLPVAPVAWVPPTEGTPIFWLIGFLFASIGLPFFVVSTTAPLLQRWFALTDHPAARDPYFLYGASNLGSIVALLGYPLIFESQLTIRGQEWAWSAGYAALAVLVAVCALMPWWWPAHTPRGQDALGRVEPITWPQRGTWTLLTFVPSSLMLGVTTYISTHIAAAPLFWVIPLTLYLLTFVFVFARRQILPQLWMARLQPIVLIPLALMLSGLLPILGVAGLVLHPLAFFIVAMVCHGELAQRRPAAANLTEFYVWMSIGGVLGGVFNALLAPLIFDGVYEYPLVLVLACLLRFRRTGTSGPSVTRYDLIVPGTLLVLLAIPIVASWRLERSVLIVVSIVVSCILLASSTKPMRFALVFALVVFGAAAVTHQFDRLVQERSFFGVNRVLLDSSGEFNLLRNGASLHGAEHRDPARQREMLTYYSKEGPLGQLFAALEQRGGLDTIALIGLGVGTSVCFSVPNEQWTIYEIDAVVVRLARDTRYFHYLQDCAPTASVVLGDARISLVGAKSHEFDLMIFDAFSSHSVPIHLLTREAIELYREKLAADGVLAFHISTNRFFDLQPVLANLANDAGMVALVQAHKVSEEMRLDYKRNSIWVVMARSAGDLGALPSDERWRRLEPRSDVRLWTDDYSNILSILRWRRPPAGSEP